MKIRDTEFVNLVVIFIVEYHAACAYKRTPLGPKDNRPSGYVLCCTFGRKRPECARVRNALMQDRCSPIPGSERTGNLRSSIEVRRTPDSRAV